MEKIGSHKKDQTQFSWGTPKVLIQTQTLYRHIVKNISSVETLPPKQNQTFISCAGVHQLKEYLALKFSKWCFSNHETWVLKKELRQQQCHQLWGYDVCSGIIGKLPSPVIMCTKHHGHITIHPKLLTQKCCKSHHFLSTITNHPCLSLWPSIPLGVKVVAAPATHRTQYMMRICQDQMLHLTPTTLVTNLLYRETWW